MHFVLRPQPPRWETLLVSMPFSFPKTNEYLSHQAESQPRTVNEK